MRNGQDAWNPLWASYERHLRVGHAPSTVVTYRRAANAFHAWLLESGRPPDPAQVTSGDVQAYLVHLREDRSWKPATIHQAHATLQGLFRWLMEEGEVDETPMLRVRAPRVDEPPPEILTEDELAALLQACVGRGFLDRRDAALIRMFIDTGLRREEMLSLTLDTVDLENGACYIVGKGGAQEVAFFGARAARDLDRYLRVRARHPKARERALWIGAKGPLGHDGLRQMLIRRGEAVGLTRTVYPHLFRHFYGHALKQAGASDEDVQTLGRWRDPRVMRRYGASAALQRARETHARLSPGDRV